MDNNKLETISNLFEGKEIRSVWDSEKEEYFFSVVDVVSALTDSKEPRKYWSVLKNRLKKEGSELTTKCSQLKMLAPDGKMRLRDTLDTKGILRLIESIPSSNAEPFKLWLAQMGKERIDEVFDPELAVNRAVNYYRSKLSQMDKIREKNYNLAYIRYNHGKYAESTFGVSNSENIPPMVQKEQFYNSLLARTKRDVINT